jgi:hypothetical protein
LLQEASMSNLIKRLSKAVCSHVLSAYVLKHDTPILDLILDVVVVNINVFSALIVARACHELDGGQVVAIELDRTEIVAKIANLLQQASKPRSFFGSVRKANVLSFSCRGCNKLLLARAVTDRAASKFEEIARSRSAILRVCK